MSEPKDASLPQLLAVLNQLHLKAFTAATREALTFMILNDTQKLVKYDRAILWSIRNHKLVCQGVSGQIESLSESPVVREVSTIIGQLQNLEEPQIIDLKGRLPGSDSTAKNTTLGLPSVAWVPIKDENGLTIGLWLERWRTVWTAEEIKVVAYLMQGYAAAWTRKQPLIGFSLPSWQTILVSTALVSLILLLIPVPLRVVAACEIIAKDPILITAPLEGIIAKVDVTPGEPVKEGQTLFTYDKRVPLQQLKIAQKQVEVTNAQLNRVLTLGLSDTSSLSESAVWKNQLAKDNIELDLARYHSSQLEVTSPTTGIALFDNPDEWRGKPVKVGERVMVVSKPGDTKVRIWVPERDNVVIRKDRPIKVILNINPLVSYSAELTYVSNVSKLGEKNIPTFTAEAEWPKDTQPDLKLGLKGTAVLYGENVSLLYWIARKPWAAIREYLGW